MKAPLLARLALAVVVAIAAGAAPRPAAAQSEGPADPPANTLTQEERQAGWRLLFDGETTAGWRGTYRDDFPEDRWKVEDGTLMIVGEDEGGGAIITEEQFGSFELALEFKMEAGANSGIKYFVLEQDVVQNKQIAAFHVQAV